MQRVSAVKYAAARENLLGYNASVRLARVSVVACLAWLCTVASAGEIERAAPYPAVRLSGRSILVDGDTVQSGSAEDPSTCPYLSGPRAGPEPADASGADSPVPPDAGEVSDGGDTIPPDATVEPSPGPDRTCAIGGRRQGRPTLAWLLGGACALLVGRVMVKRP
jgi:hypothetical protein